MRQNIKKACFTINKICLVVNKNVVKMSAYFTASAKNVYSGLRNGLYTAQQMDSLSGMGADKCFALKKVCICQLK